MLIKILALLDHDLIEAREAALLGGVKALRRRRSGLKDRETWKKLELPEQLLEILFDELS